jgi:hypothetical protein
MHSPKRQHFLHNLDEKLVDSRRIKPSLVMVTSEGHEVGLSGLLKSLKSMRHGERLRGFLPACSDE